MAGDDQGQSLEDLLVFVKESRGFDFTGYKRSSVQRRVTKRMAEVGAERYDDYIDYLQLHADEFAQLFNTLLINVTGFFRDLQTWEYMAEEIVPQLVASRPADTPLRVWSAGCASGEEAYTVAMVLARVLGDEAFRTRVKIYATDVDEEALDYARLGAYLPRQIEDVPREALDRFFERTEQRYVFRKDLRRCVIFGRNDLVQDAPISRIDLLVCRNTLMYFTAETQSQMLRRFHFALDDDGVLLLGKSEMLITHANLFTPVDLKRRVFKKVIKPALRDRVRVLTSEPGNGAGQSTSDDLREAAFDIGGGAQIVLDAEGMLMMTNAVARRTFGLGVSDLGRPVQDLELSYRPLELRSHLELVISSRHATEVRAVPWRSGDRDRLFDVHMVPVVADGLVLGTSINYVDVTEPHRLQDAVATSKRELEQAYEELQATVEELETTNEELQSTNEELETTNEELQSSNEELETTNEELQSSNEELETMNDELRHRTLELNDVNGFLETVLTTIGSAVAVIDRNQHVQIWNRQARELWGLTPEEVEDQHLLSLDFGLPVERVRSQLRAALSGGSEREEVVLAAVNRRGQAFDCRVTVLPLGAPQDGNGSGVIMMMEPVESSEPVGSPEPVESPEPVGSPEPVESPEPMSD
jgi:two-component system CheB/CheR fusion protein